MLEGTVKRMTDWQPEPQGLAGLPGLLVIEYETPLGWPNTDKVTDWVVPASKVLVITFWVKASPDVLVTFDVPEFERL